MKFVGKIWGAWFGLLVGVLLLYEFASRSCPWSWAYRFEIPIAGFCALLAMFGAAVGATLTFFFAGRAVPGARTLKPSLSTDGQAAGEAE